MNFQRHLKAFFIAWLKYWYIVVIGVVLGGVTTAFQVIDVDVPHWITLIIVFGLGPFISSICAWCVLADSKEKLESKLRNELDELRCKNTREIAVIDGERKKEVSELEKQLRNKDEELAELKRKLDEKPLTAVELHDELEQLLIEGGKIKSLWIKGDISQREVFIKWRAELEALGKKYLNPEQMKELRQGELKYDDYIGILTEMAGCPNILPDEKLKTDFFDLFSKLRELSLIVNGRPTKLL